MKLVEYLINNSHCPFCKNPTPVTFTNDVKYETSDNTLTLQVTQAIFRNVHINLLDNTYDLRIKHKDPGSMAYRINAKKIRIIKKCLCPQEFKSLSQCITFRDDFTIDDLERESISCKVSSFRISNNYKLSKTSVIDTTIEPPYSLMRISSYREFSLFSWENLEPEQILKKIQIYSIFS